MSPETAEFGLRPIREGQSIFNRQLSSRPDQCICDGDDDIVAGVPGSPIAESDGVLNPSGSGLVAWT